MSDFLNNRGNYVVRAPFTAFLDTNGDGTGDYDAIGDYSATATDFYYAPPVNETVEVTQLLYHVADKGTFDLDGYGAIVEGVITNGVQILVERLGQIALRITNGVPLLSNADISHLNNSYRLFNYTSNEQVSNVTLDQVSFGTPLLMHGDLGDKLIVRLNDNFVGLQHHHFIIYGKS